MRAFALALFCLLALAFGATAEERIAQFNSDVTVNVDGSLDVTEIITVDVENQQIRHGIFRDFPTDYQDKNGRRVTAEFEVLTVQLDGRDAPYVVEGISGGERVRIGDADVVVSRGRHSYMLRYRTTRQIGFFDTYDELYWNVTGNGWDFAIDEARVRIDLPAGASVGENAGYTGPSGASGADYRVTSASGNSYSAETTARLAPREGFTVAVAWQKGIVTPPSEAQKRLWFLRDNSWLFAGLGTLLLVGIYYLFAWAAFGRDPPKGQVIPLFRPPKGFGPAEIRYVREQSSDDKTFAAALVGLGVKGRLRISDDGDDYTVAKIAAAGGDALTKAEDALYAAMPGGSTLLKQANHSAVGKMKQALAASLAESYKGSHFIKNIGWFVGGAVLSIAGLALAALLMPGDQGAVILFMAAWLGIWWSVILAGLWGNLKRLKSSRGLMNKAGSAFSLLFLIPFIVAGLAVPASVLVFDQIPRDMVLFAGWAIGLFAVNLLFYYLLKAPTEIGQKVLAEIDGFRLYMATAEEERLNMLNPPEKTPELFERYLPYAIALDCENEWGAKFASVLAAAAAAGAATSPIWYSGSHWNDSNPGGFANDLGSSFASHLGSSATAPGSSSGSSGGGSSGGGGGGGGGGGW